MAKITVINLEGATLISPSSLWEAMRLGFWLWRYPGKYKVLAFQKTATINTKDTKDTTHA